MICTFQRKLIAFFLLAMTLLEGDSVTELSSKAGHYLKNGGIKVGFKTKWAVHSLYKVQTLSGVNWPNSHPVFAKPVPSPRLIEIFFMPKYRQRLLWIDHSLNKIFFHSQLSDQSQPHWILRTRKSANSFHKMGRGGVIDFDSFLSSVLEINISLECNAVAPIGTIIF